MVSKARINRFGLVRIGYRNSIRVEDINKDYLNNLKKDELVNFGMELASSYQCQRKELVDAYKEVTTLKDSIRQTKIYKTKAENKLKDVLIDYHLATRKMVNKL